MSERDIRDRPRDVRDGEQLDQAALAAWLAQQPSLGGTGPLEVLQFPSGYSNLTYLIRWGDHDLVLRRPPHGHTIKTGHDMGREFRVLSKLSQVYPLAPAPVAYCEDLEVMGAPFYLMQRLHGVILRRSLPKGVTLEPERARALSTNFIDNLAALHTIDLEAAGLADFGKPEGYVERQVSGWSRRYDKAATEEVPDMLAVAAWLESSRPPERGAGLIHNDYKYDNIVLDPQDLTRLIGVLDWEMSTLGDPFMDLGTSLAYWVQEDDPPEMKMLAFGPTHLPGSLTRAQLLARYEATRGSPVPEPGFYVTFGLFKIAVIIQQIYARYVAGLTKDPRFAPLGHMVKLLGQRARSLTETGQI